ncbi:hypothetical protein Tco_1150201, partial [Tanacetum coccineum]
MSNTNMQTQTSNALHNAIMEAGGKDRPPMLAPVPVAEGSSETTTEGYMENYKNVSQDIRDQLNAEAEAVQIILTGINNDIYSIVDAYPNACEMWKAIERLKQVLTSITTRMAKNEVNKIRAERLAHTTNPLALVARQQLVYHPQNHPNHNTQYSSTRSQQATRNRGKATVNSSAPIYDQELATVTEDDEMSKEKEIDKLMALISRLFKKIYKPTNNNLRTSSNTSRVNQDNSLRINRGTGHVSRESDWKDDTDDESNDQELEAHYMYMAQIQKVTPDAADNSRPIFDVEPLHKGQGDTNITIDSLDMCYDREQDDNDELDQERDLLASLIEKLKCEIDDSKNHNKFLESSNQALVDKLKGEIEDFKIKNKSLESSNNHFKEANNELSKTNQLMFKDLKKFQAELDRYHDVNYASKVAIDCAKAKGDLMSYK